MQSKVKTKAQETVWWTLRKFNRELLYALAIPPLGPHPMELKAGTQTPAPPSAPQHSHNREQAELPWVPRQTSGDKMWPIHTME